ncbi:MAG TPA: hypothetical protein VGH66_14820 [Acidimicrobiales bacterium]|jgi:hypothetical protein
MTETNGAAVALPTLVSVTMDFNRRLPAQRFLDLLARVEPVPFPQLSESQPFRLVAFRALMRDYPDRDPTSLWMHAYDCEVQIVDEDPTLPSSPTPEPLSAATTAAFPATSTS